MLASMSDHMWSISCSLVYIHDVCLYCHRSCVFFFQAEDGIRDLVRSRGLGDVYKRQDQDPRQPLAGPGEGQRLGYAAIAHRRERLDDDTGCLLYTSDAADERSSVDLGGRRIIKKKNSVRVGGRAVIHTRMEQTISTTIKQEYIVMTKRIRVSD